MLPAHVAEQALDEMHLGARHTYRKKGPQRARSKLQPQEDAG